MKNVLFIGLGTMGYHMAGHLARLDSISLTVYNRTTNKSKQWHTEFNTPYIETLSGNLQAFDIVILCLGRDEDVREIVGGNDSTGLISELKPGSIIVDHTTTSYTLACELHTLTKEKNIAFIDAPVSGGEAGAVNGLLSIMAGGEKHILNIVSPLLQCYSQTITHIGNTGYGQLAKMVNQICITGVLKGLSEGLLFAEAHQLDMPILLEAISKGAAGSWQMSNRLLTMHQREFDFGFMLKWMVKDIGYALSQAKKHNLTLDNTAIVHNSYQKLCEKGHETKDTSALILEIEKTYTNLQK